MNVAGKVKRSSSSGLILMNPNTTIMLSVNSRPEYNQ